KAAIYAEAEVDEYWIVLAEAGQVEVYRRPENGLYKSRRLYGRGEVIEEVGVTGASLEMLLPLEYTGDSLDLLLVTG
ncbi:MAG: Uma2 family endonuclease, partial [Terriglobus roseus]|nr:Uma2 family endonuclease [Terriglobus roseus]